MIKMEIVIKNRTGLHARPAAIFVQIANKYESDITIIKDDQEVNGKSIMGILMLAAERGSKIILTADGSDEEAAMRELSAVLLNDHDRDI
ncbi:MAG: HPr family phosphocarrier protein [Candidatus Omnitrophota bacterium]